MNGTMTKPASYKQLKWLRDLLNTKDFSNFPADWRDYCDYIKEAYTRCEGEGYEPGSLNVWLVANDKDEVTHQTFQTLLPKLQEANKVQKPLAGDIHVDGQADPVSPIATMDGVFKKGDTFYKLKWTRKTNKLWAHRLVFLMTPEQAKVAAAAGSKEHAVKFKFAGSPQTLGIREDMKLSYEDMKAFGALYNTCCECGRLLTNDLSVALGIGPVCGGRMFGGEFKFMISEAKLKVEAAKSDPTDTPEYIADANRVL
jgi:hypothetical protein